jgi:hypothetical protein
MLVLGPNTTFGFFGYDENGNYDGDLDLPDETTIFMDRAKGVDINDMKTKIADSISQRIQQGLVTTKNNICRVIHPDMIDIDELESLSDYDEDVDFTISPNIYTVEVHKSTTRPKNIKAYCEDDLISKLPTNYLITQIDRVSGREFIAHVNDVNIENAESLATLVHIGKTNRHVAHNINQFLSNTPNLLDDRIFYSKKNGKGKKSKRKVVKKSKRKVVKKSRRKEKVYKL